jgi:hypothetical protein
MREWIYNVALVLPTVAVPADQATPDPLAHWNLCCLVIGDPEHLPGSLGSPSRNIQWEPGQGESLSPTRIREMLVLAPSFAGEVDVALSAMG